MVFVSKEKPVLPALQAAIFFMFLKDKRYDEQKKCDKPILLNLAKKICFLSVKPAKEWKQFQKCHILTTNLTYFLAKPYNNWGCFYLRFVIPCDFTLSIFQIMFSQL